MDGILTVSRHRLILRSSESTMKLIKIIPPNLTNPLADLFTKILIVFVSLGKIKRSSDTETRRIFRRQVCSRRRRATQREPQTDRDDSSRIAQRVAEPEESARVLGHVRPLEQEPVDETSLLDDRPQEQAEHASPKQPVARRGPHRAFVHHKQEADGGKNYVELAGRAEQADVAAHLRQAQPHWGTSRES